MAKFVDFESDREVCDIMEATVSRFPEMFEGFDTSKIGFVKTLKKKGSAKKAIKIHKVAYPNSVWMTQAYVCETNSAAWTKMDQTRKNLSVFKAMCSIPNGGFDDQSKSYGKVLKPDISMFTLEYGASGGIVHWEENPVATDPMQTEASDIIKACPNVEAIPED